MTDFVLVHGAWHGGWAWEKVAPLLSEAGHGVASPDLPGHGDDGTPIPEVSLDGYARRVCGLLDDRSEPGVLVGHSMGGIVISEVAERRPEKVLSLVYLTAFLLPDGRSLVDYAQQDEESVVTQNLDVDEDAGVTTLLEEVLKDAFYGDCSEEDARRAVGRIQPQPWQPFVTPVNITEGRFGRVPRDYVECLNDRAITPRTQRKMQAGLPCRRVVSMRTDHSPFISAPEELAEHLTSLSRG